MYLTRKLLFTLCLLVCGVFFLALNNVCLAQNNQNIESTAQQDCASCHQQESEDFAEGIHSENGLTCTTCHEAHDTGAGVHEDSMSDPKNIPETCGSCHSQEVVKSYQDSFHGRALFLGNTEAADCAGCHDAHKIVESTDPDSPVAAANIPDTCGECHEPSRENYAIGSEHKLMEPSGEGSAQYWTFKFFIWLTILSVIGLILHMEMELLHLLRKAGNRA